MSRNQLSFTKVGSPDVKWDELTPEDNGWSSAHVASLAYDLSGGRPNRRLGM
jgi:hypothetical protein